MPGGKVHGQEALEQNAIPGRIGGQDGPLQRAQECQSRGVLDGQILPMLHHAGHIQEQEALRALRHPAEHPGQAFGDPGIALQGRAHAGERLGVVGEDQPSRTALQVQGCRPAVRPESLVQQPPGGAQGPGRIGDPKGEGQVQRQVLGWSAQLDSLGIKTRCSGVRREVALLGERALQRPGVANPAVFQALHVGPDLLQEGVQFRQRVRRCALLLHVGGHRLLDPSQLPALLLPPGDQALPTGLDREGRLLADPEDGHHRRPFQATQDVRFQVQAGLLLEKLQASFKQGIPAQSLQPGPGLAGGWKQSPLQKDLGSLRGTRGLGPGAGRGQRQEDQHQDREQASHGTSSVMPAAPVGPAAARWVTRLRRS